MSTFGFEGLRQCLLGLPKGSCGCVQILGGRFRILLLEFFDLLFQFLDQVFCILRDIGTLWIRCFQCLNNFPLLHNSLHHLVWERCARGKQIVDTGIWCRPWRQIFCQWRKWRLGNRCSLDVLRRVLCRMTFLFGLSFASAFALAFVGLIIIGIGAMCTVGAVGAGS